MVFYIINIFQTLIKIRDRLIPARLKVQLHSDGFLCQLKTQI